ncbi:MAG: hypothetical protein ABF269_03515, partial [Candidatus Arcticimaribacter sp.]
MGIFDQLFGKNKPKKKKDQSQYLPEKSDAKEIQFAHNFTQRGGKFVYCEDAQSTSFYFQQILQENGWSSEDVVGQNNVLSSFFKLENNTTAPKAFVMHCEYLI